MEVTMIELGEDTRIREDVTARMRKVTRIREEYKNDKRREKRGKLGYENEGERYGYKIREKSRG